MNQIIDNLMQRTKALPAAGASASTDVVDLGVTSPANGTQVPLQIRLTLPALPSLADTKNCTLEIQDCDTSDGSFASVEGTGNMKVTGAGGAGAAAKVFRVFLPPNVRRYLKAKATVDGSGGDNTAKSLTVDFLV